MAFCRVLLSLSVLCLVTLANTSEVPVFLWGDIGRTSIEHSALSSVAHPEFRKILKKELIEDPFTVVFIEETLSVEDLSRKMYKETSFPYLEANIGDAVYLPSVETPLRELQKLGEAKNADHVKLTDSGLSADLNSEDGKFLFIYLKDAEEGETREDLLRRHNDFMEDMFTKLQDKYGKVAAIYTANFPSWTVAEHNRVRRQADNQGANSGTPSVTSLTFNGLKIYFQKVLMNNGSADAVLTGAQGDPTSVVNDTMMASTLLFADDVKATLNFETMGGYWFLQTASLSAPSGEEKTLYPLEPSNSLFGYTGFSYRCAVNVTFASKEIDNSTNTHPWTLTFQNARIQPFFVTNSSNLEFGDMLNCVGFFTAPIWAGIFVVAILLAITFFGITMIMEIRTMDRFDDPKGKTITINTSE